jgi:uncharacterized protein (TIGR03083 family)
MEEKERLIRQLDEARETMRAVLADIDPTMEVYPTWTIKHVLAHITGWDDATISSLRAHAGGNEPPTPAVEGINVYNAQSVATRQALDYRQVVKEWEAARAQLKTTLNEMPPDKFQETLLFPWGPRGKIARLIAIFADHEEEHAQEIQELKAKSAY